MDSGGWAFLQRGAPPPPPWRSGRPNRFGTVLQPARQWAYNGTFLEYEIYVTDRSSSSISEMQYFGNLAQSGGGDYDGDGLTNAQEYAVGTNPTQAYSNGTGKTDGQWDKDGDSISNAGEFNWSRSDPNRAISLMSASNDGAAMSAITEGANPTGLYLQVTAGVDPVPLTIINTQAGQDYLIFSAEMMTGPWKVEKIVAGSSSQTQTTIPMNGRPVLFLLGGTMQDSDGDGLPDAYEVLVTRTVFDAAGASQDGNVDMDGDGWTNLQEYRQGTNPTQAPNPPRFSVRFPEYDTRSTQLTATISVSSGTPLQMAVQINNRNFDAATWVPWVQRRLRNAGFAPRQTAPNSSLFSSPRSFDLSVSFAPRRSSLIPSHLANSLPNASWKSTGARVMRCHRSPPWSWTSPAYPSRPITSLLGSSERTSKDRLAAGGAVHFGS